MFYEEQRESLVSQILNEILFNALVLPHFDYCSLVWDNSSAELKTQLQRLQNNGPLKL